MNLLRRGGNPARRDPVPLDPEDQRIELDEIAADRIQRIARRRHARPVAGIVRRQRVAGLERERAGCRQIVPGIEGERAFAQGEFLVPVGERPLHPAMGVREGGTAAGFRGLRRGGRARIASGRRAEPEVRRLRRRPAQGRRAGDFDERRARARRLAGEGEEQRALAPGAAGQRRAGEDERGQRHAARSAFHGVGSGPVRHGSSLPAIRRTGQPDSGRSGRRLCRGAGATAGAPAERVRNVAPFPRRQPMTINHGPVGHRGRKRGRGARPAARVPNRSFRAAPKPAPAAPVAQLDRAPDYGSGGWEFESSRARQLYS